MLRFFSFLLFIFTVADCFAQSVQESGAQELASLEATVPAAESSLLGSTPEGSTLIESTPWQKLENGLEIYEAGDNFLKFHVVRLQKGRHGIKVLGAQDYGKRVMSASEVCAASGALMCVNASFFDENSNPLGLIVSSGILFQKVHQGGDTLNGIFSLSRKGFSIVDRQSFSKQLSFEAIQAGPRILSAGINLRDNDDKNVSKRTALCINAEGAVRFFISTDKSRASSLYELAEYMKKEPLDCVEGLNLDGGGSSQMYLKEKNTKAANSENAVLELAGQDKVPLFLGVVEGMPF